MQQIMDMFKKDNVSDEVGHQILADIVACELRKFSQQKTCASASSNSSSSHSDDADGQSMVEVIAKLSPSVREDMAVKMGVVDPNLPKQFRCIQKDRMDLIFPDHRQQKQLARRLTIGIKTRSDKRDGRIVYDWLHNNNCRYNTYGKKVLVGYEDDERTIPT